MVTCKAKINFNRVDIEVFNSEGPKTVSLEIRDVDSNFRVIVYKFNILEYESIWNILPYNPYEFDFFNGYKLSIINNETKAIEWSDVLLIRPYTNTKFIDKDDILPHDITCVINNNHLECFKNYPGDEFGLKDAKVVVDLGSSVGIFTSYALSRNPNLKYICVELNPNFHKICTDTFKDNPNVIPINAAIYKTSGEKIIVNSVREDLYDFGNTVVNNLYIGQNFKSEINTISLYDIVNTYNIDKIDLLKVDIEGYEYELFENLSDEFLSKVDKIHFEFHNCQDPMRKMNLINRLQMLGYSMKVYDEKVNFYQTQLFTIFFTK